jgi:hypothetical protein
MLPIPVHAQNPIELPLARHPPARPQGGPFAAVGWVSNHFRASPDSFRRGAIGGTIVHHDDAGQVTLNSRHDRTNSTGFIEARYHCGALPFPINHSLAMARSGAV